MNKYFVTGTDTDVGKTLACAVLLLALRGSYWKPVQSGIPDLETIKFMTQLPAQHFFPAQYSLQAPLSPDQAAARENIDIDLHQLVLPQTQDSLIVEGAGGVYTPLNQNQSMLDLMQKFNLPIVIVCRGTLGTINHTLMTIDVLRQRKLQIHGVIFNGELNQESKETIEKWGQVRTLLEIPNIPAVTTSTLMHVAENNKNIIKSNFL